MIELKEGKYVKNVAYFNSGGTPVARGALGTGQPGGTIKVMLVVLLLVEMLVIMEMLTKLTDLVVNLILEHNKVIQ